MTGFPIFSGKVVGARRAMGDYNAIVKKQETDVWAENEYGELIADGEAGVDDASVIQKALDSLTPNRSWKEKVVLLGNFTLNNQITLSSYTILQIIGKLYLKDGSNTPLISTNVGVEHVEVVGGILDHNGAKQQGGQAALWFRDVTNGLIRDVTVLDAYSRGIEVDGGELCTVENCVVNKTYNTDYGNGIMLWSGDKTVNRKHTVINCRVFNSAKTGIDLGTVAGVKVIGCYVENAGSIGIANDDCGGDIIIAKCTAVGNGSDGINVITTARVIGCVCAYNGRHGIRVIGDNSIIIGNKCYNNNQVRASNHGIGLEGCSCVIVKANMCWDDQDTKTQSYGISEYLGADYNIIICNNVWGNDAGGINSSGANTIVKHYLNYITENSGTATFSGDGSTKDFLIGDHGLAVTDPSKIVVKVTPISSDAIAASPCIGYVDPNDNAKIRVKFASAPASGTDNVKIVWEAQVV